MAITGLEADAGEKAGIIKKNIPVVIGERQSSTDDVFFRFANANNSPIVWAEDTWKVDRLSHFETVVFERATQYIGEYKHGEIADVLTVVHGRTAVVHAHLAHVRGQEKLLLFHAERIKKIERRTPVLRRGRFVK